MRLSSVSCNFFLVAWQFDIESCVENNMLTMTMNYLNFCPRVIAELMVFLVELLLMVWDCNDKYADITHIFLQISFENLQKLPMEISNYYSNNNLIIYF